MAVPERCHMLSPISTPLPVFHFPPSLDRSTIGSIRNQRQGRCRALMMQARTQAMRVMPSAQLGPKDKQRFDFVRTGFGRMAVVIHRGSRTRYFAGEDEEWMASNSPSSSAKYRVLEPRCGPQPPRRTRPDKINKALLVVQSQPRARHHAHSLRPHLHYQKLYRGLVVSDCIGTPLFTFPHPSIAQSLAPYDIRNDKATVKLLIVQVQTRAVRVMPGVQLRPNDKQHFIDFVRAGPAGGLWSPTFAQGLATT